MSKLHSLRFAFLGLGFGALISVPSYLSGVVTPRADVPWMLPAAMIAQVTCLFIGTVLVIRARYGR